MRALRMLLAAAICVVAAIAIHRVCWNAYRCNIDKKDVEARLARAAAQTETARLSASRFGIARMQKCVAHDPADYQAQILLAHAYEIGGAKERAMEWYRAALAVNERPEIYTSIGLLQLENGDLDTARRNLLRASYFSVEYTASVDEPLRTELYTAAEQRLKQLQLK